MTTPQTAPVQSSFSGAMPETYQRLLVPLIFEPFAKDMAARLKTDRPLRILETAAGTGVVTRMLAARMAPGSQFFATDISEAMLARAQAQSSKKGPIAWSVQDGQSLTFADESFDCAFCQFGVMFFADRVAGFSEARRVLKPGGQFIFNVWDKLAHNDFPATLNDAVARVYPNSAPDFLERVPHGYFDEARIRSDLAAAGWSNTRVERVNAICRAENAESVAIAYCHGTPLRAEIESRLAPNLETVTDRATEALQARFGRGPIEGRMQALVVTATR